MLIDSRANADARPEYLLPVRPDGSIYMARMHGIDRPRGPDLNGEEEVKGNELIRKRFLHAEASHLNYVSNIRPKVCARTRNSGRHRRVHRQRHDEDGRGRGWPISGYDPPYIMAWHAYKIGGALARPAPARATNLTR